MGRAENATQAAVEPRTHHPKPHAALVLFAGPSSNPHNIQHLLRARGIRVDSYDITEGDHQNIADDAVWDPIMARLKAGDYAVLLASPPCSSFSRLRGTPGGPPALRAVDGPGRYGLPELSVSQKE